MLSIEHDPCCSVHKPLVAIYRAARRLIQMRSTIGSIARLCCDQLLKLRAICPECLQLDGHLPICVLLKTRLATARHTSHQRVMPARSQHHEHAKLDFALLATSHHARRRRLYWQTSRRVPKLHFEYQSRHRRHRKPMPSLVAIEQQKNCSLSTLQQEVSLDVVSASRQLLAHHRQLHL